MDLNVFLEQFAEMVAQKIANQLENQEGAAPKKRCGRPKKAEKPVKEPKPESEKPVKEPKPESEKPVKEPKPESEKPVEEKQVGKSDLNDPFAAPRKLLRDLANRDRDRAIQLLKKYGAKRLPEVPLEKIDEFMEENQQILEDM